MNSSAEKQNVPQIIPLTFNKGLSANMQLKTLLDVYMKDKKVFIKESTWANWQLFIENQIKPYFGTKKLNMISEGDIQDFILHLYTKGRKDGKGGLSVKTIRDLMVPLKQAFGYAERYRIITPIRWDMVEYPSVNRQDNVKALTFEQQKKLVQAFYMNLSNKTAAYMIVLFTGLRIGEICGLQMKDISLTPKTISINKTIQRIYDKKKGKSHLYIGPPKTATSRRTIPIPDALVPIIERFYDADHEDRYFITGTKYPTEPRTLRQHFNRFLKRNELPKMKFHELRHTFATRAMEINGFDIKSLSAILGHKNPAFTMNVYGRANLDKERECMNLMSKLI